MANRVTLQPTEFSDLPAVSFGVSFGFRMYDDHGQSYCNTMDKSDMELPALEFIEKAKMHFDEQADAMFDFALDQGGLYVGKDWVPIKREES